MKELTRSTLVTIVASSLSLLAFYAINASAQSAWTPAPANAPSGNVAGPLTTGATGQSKAGNLMLNTDGTLANGLIVANGNVGIGTITPTAKVHIDASAANTTALELDTYGSSSSSANSILFKNTNQPGFSWQMENAWDGSFRIGRSGDSAAGTYPFFVQKNGNIAVGAASANNSKGTGGYLDAKDVYLRDAGKWASQLGGTGSAKILLKSEYIAIFSGHSTEQTPNGFKLWIDASGNVFMRNPSKGNVINLGGLGTFQDLSKPYMLSSVYVNIYGAGWGGEYAAWVN